MTIKVIATHVSLNAYSILHVEGDRQAVINRVNTAFDAGYIGVDLPILVRRDPANHQLPYQRTQLWVGVQAIAEGMIADSHEVDLDETPLELHSHNNTPVDDGLVVSL